MNVIVEKQLTLNDCNEILFNGKQVSIPAAALKKVDDSHQFLKQFSKNKLIYGINTGFGPMAQYKVSEENITQLQYNLIRSHCSGGGKLLEPILVKALMLARLNSLLQGFSGVHTDIIELLVTLINKNVYPCIYEHGGVGASGDLVQLAHLALVLIGEGEVIYEETMQPTEKIFKQLEHKTAVHLHARRLGYFKWHFGYDGYWPCEYY